MVIAIVFEPLSDLKDSYKLPEVFCNQPTAVVKGNIEISEKDRLEQRATFMGRKTTFSEIILTLSKHYIINSTIL